jgi:hypothetical protein
VKAAPDVEATDQATLRNDSDARINLGLRGASAKAVHANPSLTVCPAAYAHQTRPLAQPTEANDAGASGRYDIAVSNTVDAVYAVRWLQESWLRCCAEDDGSVEIDILFARHRPKHVGRTLCGRHTSGSNVIATSHAFVSISIYCVGRTAVT